MDNLLFNERRQKDSIKLFEISDVYSSSNGIDKKRKLSIIASGRVGENYTDFSKKINKKYLLTLFQEILPNEVFDFKLVSRDLLDTKIKNEIVSLEVDINSFSSDILSYKEVSQSPEGFAQYSPISDFPSSLKTFRIQLKIIVKLKNSRIYCLIINLILLKIFIFLITLKMKRKKKLKLVSGLLFNLKKQL